MFLSPLAGEGVADFSPRRMRGFLGAPSSGAEATPPPIQSVSTIGAALSHKGRGRYNGDPAPLHQIQNGLSLKPGTSDGRGPGAGQ